MMEYFGYIISIFIGITLGVFGSGGSILAVPVFVYIFGIEPLLATLYSLFIVGSTTFIGSLTYFKNKSINFNIVLLFGLTSVIFVIISRKLILPTIPDIFFSTNNFAFTKSKAIMILFAILMLFASYSMIKKGIEKIIPNLKFDNPNYLLLIFQGAFVGSLTGLVGAGGGFLIIPALVIFMKSPIKEAIGTSLVIISLNSLIGFLSDFGDAQIEWIFLFKFLLFSVFGIFLGNSISKRINNEKLKPYFGYFILLMGILVIMKELFFK
jgi:uncharacterized protein